MLATHNVAIPGKALSLKRNQAHMAAGMIAGTKAAATIDPVHFVQV